MTSVKVPVGLHTEGVMLRVVLAEGIRGLVAQETAVSLGVLPTSSVTGWLKPLTAVTDTVYVILRPRAIVCVTGWAASSKSGAGVFVGVAVEVAVAVGVLVGVAVEVAVAVGVLVGVAVDVAVAVGVLVGVAVDVAFATEPLAIIGKKAE
jgi:hypothetical protein